jgi:ABC-type transport system involved in multi-copper enzyme maturation permease subunit
MRGSIAAELLVLRKRVSTWILLGIWIVLALAFSYLLPWLTYRNSLGTATPQPLAPMLPQSIVSVLLGGFPFYGGALALMLGVLSIGSEYGWDILKTLFTQGPSRLRLFAAKLAALGIALIPFVLLVFAFGAICSTLIASAEHAAITWPGAWVLVRALFAGWFILAVWTALGLLLAVLTRGTSLAIGCGILWMLIVEGLVSALFNQSSLLRPVVKIFIRANAYSLGRPLGAVVAGGPGTFAGPYVGATQALFVLALYLCGFILLGALVLRHRDVT